MLMVMEALLTSGDGFIGFVMDGGDKIVEVGGDNGFIALTP